MSFMTWLKARITPEVHTADTAPPPPPGAQAIAIMNRSSLVSDSNLSSYVNAIQIQVTRDFIPQWCPGKAYALVFVAKATQPPAGTWQVAVMDTPDMAGVLGYHELTSDGLPLGKVFAAADVQYGDHVSGTLSHEVLEMIGNPNINLTEPGLNNWLYSNEACDPCEDEAFGYSINGVIVSDFIFPSYFDTDANGPFDFRSHILHPLQILSGGYQSYFDGSDWRQIQGDRILPEKPSKREYKNCDGCRHWKRRLARASWRKSEPSKGETK